MKTFFDKPTQVMFVDEEGTWQFGIAYGKEIICGCCGGINEIEEIIEFAPDYVQCPIHEYSSWTNLNDEIFGGEYPESFIIEPVNPNQEDNVMPLESINVEE